MSIYLTHTHAGKYLFEKLLSGMFLGEVARRILLRLSAETKLLGRGGRKGFTKVHALV